MTRFRAWVAEALSGDVVGEVHLSGQAQFISRFGGGTFTAGVSVAHLTRRDGDGPDWDAVERVVEWCTGGKYTLVLTQGQTTIGEWLIVRPLGATDSGVIRIDGHELDGYPAMRAIFKAQSTANSAQSTANAAQTAAGNAQSTANGAATAAASAQSSADQANDRITDARGSYGSLTLRLNAMGSATATAQSTANGAQSTANSVQSEVTTARAGSSSLNARITAHRAALQTVVNKVDDILDRLHAIDNKGIGQGTWPPTIPG